MSKPLVCSIDRAPADSGVYPEFTRWLVALRTREKINHVTGRTDEDARWRIAHLTTADISLALLLATELDERVKEGHEVLGISAPGPYVERVEALGVRHVPILELTRSWNPVQDLRAFLSIWRTLRRLNLDVLHTHNPKTGVMGRVAGRLAGVPVVVNTCHGLWATPEDSLLKRAFVYGLEGLAARFSDYELFQNAQDEHTLRGFLKPDRHKVVGNGIDLQRFRFDPAGRARLRAQWGVHEDELLVGTVGRRVREKGLVEYAQVAQFLGKPVRFVWVGPEDGSGDGPPQGLDVSSVQFVPEQTDMPAVYSAFDLFVLPSYREGFSRASMEAASCGLPMILTDIRGCREIGDNGTHLVLVEPRNVTALRDAVARLAGQPGERRRLGDAARDRAQRLFDQRMIAAISRETYTSVLRTKRRSSHRRHSSPAPRPITVLHVLPVDMNRGAQVYAAQLRDALADDPQQRHSVLSIFTGQDTSYTADIPLGVPSGPLRRGLLDPRGVRRLKDAIRTLDVDVVIAHGGESLKYLVAAGPSVPVVYYKVGLSSGELARPGRLSLYRMLASRAARVVAVSEAVRDQCVDVLRLPADKVSVIPNGRDPTEYRVPADGESRANPPLLLWVGRFESGKRPEVFLDIVAAMRQRGLEFEAMMVGAGPLWEPLSGRARRLQVALPGPRADVAALLRKASALALTSAPGTEGMPGVLIEAGMSGLATVATTAAGVDDVVVDGETGYVVAPDDVLVLADRLEDILYDRGLARRMGEQARERCVQYFSIEATAALWAALVDQLANVDEVPVPKPTLRRGRIA